MPKKKYHHGNLREALIEAAREILTSEGVEALSLRKVARQAGVSATALYSHFSDKRELLAVLATHGFEELSASMEAELQSIEETENGNASLVGLGRGYVRFATQNPALFQLMFGREVGDLLDTPGLVEAGRRTYSLMADRVSAQLERNGSDTSPAIAATAAWSLVHGLSTLLNNQRVSAHGAGMRSSEDLVQSVCQILNLGD